MSHRRGCITKITLTLVKLQDSRRSQNQAAGGMRIPQTKGGKSVPAWPKAYSARFVH